jgi:hypothetical protein
MSSSCSVVSRISMDASHLCSSRQLLDDPF